MKGTKRCFNIYRGVSVLNVYIYMYNYTHIYIYIYIYTHLNSV